ncbi:MAG: hypothetical protein ACRCYZ_06420 [Alphaproteobacteria bacterium]
MIKYFMISTLFVSSLTFAIPDSMPESEGEQIEKMWDKHAGDKNFLNLIDAQEYILTTEEMIELGKNIAL